TRWRMCRMTAMPPAIRFFHRASTRPVQRQPSSKSPHIVQDVPYEEGEPAHPCQQKSNRLARAVVDRIFWIFPKVPIDREQTEPEGGDVLFQFEEAERLPVTGSLERNAHRNPVLGIDPGTHDKGHDPQDAHGRRVTRAI